MSIRTQNNYEAFKSDFKKDTGLDYSKDTISEYLQYINFRQSDHQAQTNLYIINHINQLPDTIRLKIGEMITSHDTIKELLKKLGNR
ncbi:hypothetical protein [Yeosuana sp.]|uniref:hypothetical protein n=1 Tax=Yeosuana sp. TaxID=2529388 RepID=UPI004054BC87